MVPKRTSFPGWAGFSPPLRRGLSRTWSATVGPFETGHFPVDNLAGQQSRQAGSRRRTAMTRPGRAGISHRCCGSARRGICYPPRQARTTGTSPTGAPWQQTGAFGLLAVRRNPPGFLGKGDVMIHRPCLVCGELDARVSSPSIH